MEVSTEKSMIMTTSTKDISADINMNGQKLEEMTILSAWSNPVQGWHLFSRNSQQDRPSIHSDGLIRQDLTKEQFSSAQSPHRLGRRGGGGGEV